MGICRMNLELSLGPGRDRSPLAMMPQNCTPQLREDRVHERAAREHPVSLFPEKLKVQSPPKKRLYHYCEN